jgi:hypothetical protein
MRRRRRPLLRAAAVGGAGYLAGKKRQQGQDDADEGNVDSSAPASGAVSDEGIDELKKLAELKEQGILTHDEFEEQKRKILDA